jgi:hypothetical protein
LTEGGGARGGGGVAAAVESPPLEVDFPFDFERSLCESAAAAAKDDGDDAATALNDALSLAEEGCAPPPLSLSDLRWSPTALGFDGDFFFLAEEEQCELRFSFEKTIVVLFPTTKSTRKKKETAV